MKRVATLMFAILLIAAACRYVDRHKAVAGRLVARAFVAPIVAVQSASPLSQRSSRPAEVVEAPRRAGADREPSAVRRRPLSVQHSAAIGRPPAANDGMLRTQVIAVEHSPCSVEHRLAVVIVQGTANVTRGRA